MSWEKNTINLSELDSVVAMLKKDNRPHTMTVLGEVLGLGLNDDSRYNYKIRRLEYTTLSGQGYVVLEQMQRTSDCDSDDHLVSMEYKKDEEPKNWQLEVRTDLEDDSSSS